MGAEFEAIAHRVFQERIKGEREFVIGTLKVALWVVGIAIAFVAGAAAFFGWQRFEAIQNELRDYAKREVARYLEKEFEIDELDRQYGEALVRTLRSRLLVELDKNSRSHFDISNSQVERLLEILLSADTQELIFYEALGVLSTVADRDQSAPWLPRVRSKIIQDLVGHSELRDALPERRAWLVEFISDIGTDADASRLRTFLNDFGAGDRIPLAIVNLERRVGPSAPLSQRELHALLDHNRSIELIAAARALSLLVTPDSTWKKEKWAVNLANEEIFSGQDHRRKELYELTLSAASEDLDRSFETFRMSQDRAEYIPHAEAFMESFLEQCDSLIVEGKTREFTWTSGGPNLEVELSCYYKNKFDGGVARISTTRRVLASLVDRELKREWTRGKAAFARAVDRWNSSAARYWEVKVQAVNVLGNRLLPTLTSLLDTVDNPKQRGARIAVARPDVTSAEGVVIPLEDIEGLGFSLNIRYDE